MRKWLLAALGVTVVLAGATTVALSRGSIGSSSSPVENPQPITLINGGATSNIWPKDYVGPAVCESCHAERFDQWKGHPHSRMNQTAATTPAAVKVDFQNARMTMPNGEAVFRRENDNAFTMSLERNDDARTLARKYRVTRTVGSRFMQFFIGVQVEGPEPRTDRIYSLEQKLPFGYWFKMKRWLPVEYFDPWVPDRNPDDGSLVRSLFDKPLVIAWANSCMFCHNTYPWAYRLGLQTPFQGYPEQDLVFHRESVHATIAQSVDGVANVPATSAFTLGQLNPDKHLVTIGISCESCHYGGRAHASEGKAISWIPTSESGVSIQPAVDTKNHSTTPPTPANAYVINSICRQCHIATQHQYANGAGVANSREALDMLAGSCATKIKCTDCHDPHVASGPEGQPASAKQLGACTGCHAKYAPGASPSSSGGRAHSHHDDAVTCLDCHMPKISQGIDQIVRSHRISSPSDPRMLSFDQPNACNVCHIDKSIGWTVRALEEKWRRGAHDKPKLAIGTGNPENAAVRTSDEAAGRIWLRAKSPYVRMTASQAWGAAPAEIAKSGYANVLDALNDEIPVNRVFAMFAVSAIRGKPLEISEYDPVAEPNVRKKQIEALSRASPLPR